MNDHETRREQHLRQLDHNQRRINEGAKVIQVVRDADTIRTEFEELIEVLADLKHWAEAYAVNFTEADRRATDHYAFEQAEAWRLAS